MTFELRRGTAFAARLAILTAF